MTKQQQQTTKHLLATFKIIYNENILLYIVMSVV